MMIEEVGLLGNIKRCLFRTSAKLSSGVKNIFSVKRKIDKDTLEELEELLITMDIGVTSAKLLVDKLSEMKFDQEVEYSEIQVILKNEIENILSPVVRPLAINHKPHVIMVCGVNGNGKTTTVGKLAYKYRKLGKSVMIAACDTFRAAAVEQLKVWADRVDCPIIIGEHGADAASVAYRSIQEAEKNDVDVLLIDTAGRLHNHTNLMEELMKICRIIKKCNDQAPHDTVLVLDATTGSNADRQVETFQKMVGISGLIITKLDGTAKGGMVVSLAQKYKIALHAIGLGEGVEDLKDFTAKEFADSLFN